MSTRPRSALIALTSHDRLGDTGRRTGAYLPEIAHPWREFRAAGFDVALVSVAGGTPPLDGVKPDDPVQQEFLDDPEMSAKLVHTLAPAEVDPLDHDVIFFAGGHGTMWDFPSDQGLAGLARAIYERGGVVAAVCHGPAALVELRLSNGRRLIDGKQVSAFTDSEETAVGLAEVVPFLLQTRLEENGAKHTGAPDFQPWVVTDERLVTGQNPASAAGVARAAVALVTTD
ncbi:type 1 glutamine amidotransferase domain-containing protein [Microlunatus ginsengisoli]|uniref:Type 1 glutamine amidotransferase domain-containing protein n=1 Tax=Microlunatus ginsengisoli TaxID=363863 RepID=A0ABP6ZWW7_9ACTN